MKSIFEKLIRGSDECPVLLSAQPIKNGKILNGVRAQAEFVKNVFQSTKRQIPFQETVIRIDSVQSAAALLQYNKKLADLNQKASYFVIHKETGNCLCMMNVYCQGKQTAEVYFMMMQNDDCKGYMSAGLKLLEDSFLGRLGFKELITNMAWDTTMHRLWLVGNQYQRKEVYQGLLEHDLRLMGYNAFETYSKTRQMFLSERQPKVIQSALPVVKDQNNIHMNNG